jgi:hypothetical protein
MNGMQLRIASRSRFWQRQCFSEFKRRESPQKAPPGFGRLAGLRECRCWRRCGGPRRGLAAWPPSADQARPRSRNNRAPARCGVLHDEARIVVLLDDPRRSESGGRMALAHSVGDSVERAYMRSTLIDKRREVMQAWAAFVNGVWRLVTRYVAPS